MTKRKIGSKRKTLDRSTAASVGRKKANAQLQAIKDQDSILDIIRNHASPARPISNRDLAIVMYGELDRERLGDDEYFKLRGERERLVRARVLALRERRHPIVLAVDTNGGYFYGERVDEILPTVNLFNERAKRSYRVASKLMGRELLDHQAAVVADEITKEVVEENQEAAMRKFLKRIMRNPITRVVYLKVVGQTISDEDRAKLDAERLQIEAERIELAMLTNRFAVHKRELLEEMEPAVQRMNHLLDALRM